MSHPEKSPVAESLEEYLDKKRPWRNGPTLPETTVGKGTNPKDAIATNKLLLGVVPDSVIVYAALAWIEGMLKYGRYNWRIAGVRASVYHDALQRHRLSYWNGEWADPKTGVPHLASIIACAGILLEAHLINNLTDDRPPACQELVDLVRGMEPTVLKLKEMFKNHDPHQYTIHDSLLHAVREG